LKKQETVSNDKPKRKRNPKNSRRRGNAYEVKIAKELQELGFPGVVTSRSESKRMDDSKVDLIDTENKLTCLLQLKLTQATPNYFKIRNECPIKDKPFCIIWNKTKPTDSTYRSEGEVVILDKEFFYKLIQKYYA
jgi:hypothetical protein